MSNTQELEMKIAFLEDSVEKLSDAYYKQQKRIDELELYIKYLNQKISKKESQNTPVLEADINEKPPHY